MWVMSLAAALALMAEVHTVPPPGVPVPDADRAALASELARLSARIEKLRWNPLVTDIAIYEKAVRFALQYNEFFKLISHDQQPLAPLGLLEKGKPGG
jgi:hypothetical protein